MSALGRVIVRAPLCWGLVLAALVSPALATPHPWTTSELSEPAIEAALDAAAADAANAKNDLAPALRGRVEQLTQLLDILREKRANEALGRATLEVPEIEVPPGKPTPGGMVELERAADQARAAERRWSDRHAAIMRLVEERAERERALREELDRLANARPIPAGKAQQVLRENRTLEQRVALERLELMAQKSEPSWLAHIDRQLEVARRGRRRALSAVRAYREDLVHALQAESRALGRASDDDAQTRRRVIQAELVRLAIDRELELQRQRLQVERNELRVTRHAVARPVQNQRTAKRLKDTLWRLQRRRPEVARNQAARFMEAAEEAQLRRLDLDDMLLDDPHFEARRLTEEQLIAAEEVAARREERLRTERLALSGLITHADALRSVIDERARVFAALEQTVRTHLFWIQDVAPIWLHLGLEGVEDIRRVARWSARITGTDTLAAVRHTFTRPVDLILLLCAALVLPIGLVFARRYLRPLLRREAAGWRAHLQGAFVAGLLASLPAGSLLLTSMLVQRSSLPLDIKSVLSPLIHTIALCWLAWLLVRYFAAKGGLVHRMLGFESAAAIETSKALSALIIGYALCLVPGSMFESKAIDARSLGRLAWLAFGVLVLVIVWRVTRQRSRLMLETGDTTSGRRTARSLRWLARLTCITVLAMEALGYHYGARWLAQKSVLTAALLVPIGISYRALSEKIGPKSSPRRRIFKSIVSVVGVVAAVLVWGVDDSAIQLLQAVHIFGDAISGVSLLDIGASCIVLTVTIVGLRWLPQVLKMTIFRAVDLDEGLQYAITTIARYLLFFIGFAALLSTLHINLEKLGWLVAALGVGLGFGLQEIVSNFVSGVIILVERPIRVGDFISIGALEGRVRYINIRSTTLLSLDRREFIVPNKDLITRDVTNWTRSDRVVRITVPIGVAYGSDIEQVRQVLLEAIADVPGVMKKPVPQVLFMNHGDSALEFEVRLHVPDPWRRFKVLDRVNAEINAALAAHDIEIPFPQRDVHIRSGLPVVG